MTYTLTQKLKEMSSTHCKELFIREILHLTAKRSRDCMTDWRINPGPTLVACTGKYPGRGYWAKS